MNLHLHKQDFEQLCALAGEYKGVSVSNVKRDYYIVLMLKALSLSDMADCCVFKGGTSLSKCYPGTINRFSEDIDLTFIPKDSLSDSKIDKCLKRLESIMSFGFEMEKIESERNGRNKSSWVWSKDEDKNSTKVKLEIGSRVRPDPFEKRTIKTFIQEFLESRGLFSECDEFELTEVEVNSLCIERTFIDKVMSVKRHALCGTLSKKVRHIYDVVSIFDRIEIQNLLGNKEYLKELVRKTKETDGFYLQKRPSSTEYDPLGEYGFELWKDRFDDTIKKLYCRLPDDLLFDHSAKLDFEKALETFEKINAVFREIGE